MKEHRKLFWQVPFLLLLIIGTIYVIRQHADRPYQHHTGKIFGTFYNITYQSDANLHSDILAELEGVDQALSMFNGGSVISHVNQGDSVIPDTPEGNMFLDVYRLAMQISKETGGAFDITVAPLVNAWGFGFKQSEMPTKDTIDSIRALIGYEKMHYSEKSGQRIISKSHPRMILDCSAIAKGYGCDRVARLLRKNDVDNFMIEIGGEIVVNGVNEKKRPWRIGVTKPTEDPTSTETQYQTVLDVTNRAMATSGNYRNFYYKDGKRYAHTIDPRTGRPVQHSILSATVIADNCATADAYATSFMVLGLDGALRILDRHPDLLAHLIYTDENGNFAVYDRMKNEE